MGGVEWDHWGVPLVAGEVLAGARVKEGFVMGERSQLLVVVQESDFSVPVVRGVHFQWKHAECVINSAMELVKYVHEVGLDKGLGGSGLDSVEEVLSGCALAYAGSKDRFSRYPWLGEYSLPSGWDSNWGGVVLFVHERGFKLGFVATEDFMGCDLGKDTAIVDVHEYIRVVNEQYGERRDFVVDAEDVAVLDSEDVPKLAPGAIRDLEVLKGLGAVKFWDKISWEE